jgi:hypothetical protein
MVSDFFKRLGLFIIDGLDRLMLLGLIAGSGFSLYARFAMISNAIILNYIYAMFGLQSTLLLNSLFLGITTYYSIAPLLAVFGPTKNPADKDNRYFTVSYFKRLLSWLFPLGSYVRCGVLLASIFGHVPVISAYVVLAFSHVVNIWSIASPIIKDLAINIFKSISSWDLAGAGDSLVKILLQISLAVFSSLKVLFSLLKQSFIWSLFTAATTTVVVLKLAFELLVFAISAVISACFVPFVRGDGKAAIINDPCFYVLLSSLLLLFDAVSFGSQVLNQFTAFILMSWLSTYVADSIEYNNPKVSMFTDRSMVGLSMASFVSIVSAAFSMPYMLTVVLTFAVPHIVRKWMDKSKLRGYFEFKVQKDIRPVESSTLDSTADPRSKCSGSVEFEDRLSAVQYMIASSLGIS